MDIAEAMELVLDLAQQNQLVLKEVENEPELFHEYQRQINALHLVEDFIVNHLGDN